MICLFDIKIDFNQRNRFHHYHPHIYFIDIKVSFIVIVIFFLSYGSTCSATISISESGRIESSGHTGSRYPSDCVQELSVRDGSSTIGNMCYSQLACTCQYRSREHLRRTMVTTF